MEEIIKYIYVIARSKGDGCQAYAQVIIRGLENECHFTGLNREKKSKSRKQACDRTKRRVLGRM